MLSEHMLDCLNQQINLEFYSSNLYLQMSSWCEFTGLEGCADFLKSHAVEEMGHMNRLFTYVNETGGLARLGQVDAPPFEFESIADLFQQTLDHEKHVTGKINHLARTSQDENDFATLNFLQWYVAEQHEEERLFKSILDRIEMIGLTGNGLFFIDQEVAKFIKVSHATNTGAP